MAKYSKMLVLNKPEGFVQFMMNDYLVKNGFAAADWKGQPAYRAGDGIMEGYKFMNWSYQNGVLQVEAWLKGTTGKEVGLDGFVGCMQKKPFKDSLEQLFVLLQQELPEEQMQNMAAQGEGTAPQPIPVATVNNTKAATSALVFSIICCILAFISPLFSVIAGVLAFTQARLGMGSTKAGLAKAGKIVAIIGVIIAIIMWILNIVVTVGGMM